jgi:hypothetical protein
MDRAQAIREVRTLPASAADFKDFAERAEQLLEDPDRLIQGPFGICAMTSTVRTLLLQDDLDEFVNLVKVIFQGGTFNGIPAPSGTLLTRRRKQFAAKKTHRTRFPRANQANPDLELDFILARSIGKLFKIKSPLAYDSALQESGWMVANFAADPDDSEVTLFELDLKYINELNNADLSGDLGKALADNDFRAWFHWGFEINPTRATISVVARNTHWVLKLAADSMPDYRERTLEVSVESGKLVVTYDLYGDYGAFQKQGDLGVGLTGMMFLMKDVIAATSYSFDFNVSEPLKVIDKVNTQFASGVSAYVYAFVHGTPSWSEAKAGTADAFANPPRPYRPYVGKPPVTGTHIVVVTAPITDAGTYVVVPTWSWGKRFDARIPKDHLTRYIGAYAYGQL